MKKYANITDVDNDEGLEGVLHQLNIAVRTFSNASMVMRDEAKGQRRAIIELIEERLKRNEPLSKGVEEEIAQYLTNLHGDIFVLEEFEVEELRSEYKRNSEWLKKYTRIGGNQSENAKSKQSR